MLIDIRDAAHTIHPLGGQGMNLGLGDVRALTESIAQCVYHGENLCKSDLNLGAQGYMKDRYLHNSLIITGCDLLYRIGGRFLSLGNNEFVKKKFLKLMA